MATISFREWPLPPGPKPVASQVLPNIVDGMAKTRPQAVYCEFPRDPMSYAKGFVKVTYENFANLINGLAWWLDGAIGPSTTFETIAYMGTNDIRYNCCVLASVKLGYNLLLPATTDSTASTIALLKKASCNKVLVSGDQRPQQLESVLQEYPMHVAQAPSVQDLFNKKHAHYPYKKTFEQAKNDPLVSVHTSGSTGEPKPVVLTHAWAAAYIRMLQLEPPEGFESNDKLWQGNRIFCMTPPFHVGNIGVTLCAAIANQTTVIMPLPSQPRNASLFLNALDHVEIDAAFLGPPIVDEIGKDTNLAAKLEGRVETVFWTGGSIAEAAGECISEKVKLFNIIGSSEAAGLPMLRPAGDWPSDLWQYVGIHPGCGAEFCHVIDDLHELRIKRNQGEEKRQPVFQIFRELDTYEMRDLFMPHPSKPNFWRHRGRVDDVITMMNSAKVHPALYEMKLMSHSQIKGAILIGQRHLSLALLLEPRDHQGATQQGATFLDQVWPLVEEINHELLGRLAVQRDKIIIAPPDKPMIRVGKGTIQRGASVSQFAPEIDEIYANERIIDYEGIRS